VLIDGIDSCRLVSSLAFFLETIFVPFFSLRFWAH
jgi:hypothetical protein